MHTLNTSNSMGGQRINSVSLLSSTTPGCVSEVPIIKLLLYPSRNIYIDLQVYVCICVFSEKPVFLIMFFNLMSNTWIHSLHEELKYYRQDKVPIFSLPQGHHGYKLNFCISKIFLCALHTHPWGKYFMSFSVFPFLPSFLSLLIKYTLHKVYHFTNS